MGKLQLKRSNVIENGKAKEPTPPLMEFGELAVNYNADDPVIFIKNHLGHIIRLVSPGQDGAKGSKGAQGLKGQKGQNGIKGAPGKEGPKGAAGDQGATGAPGIAGAKGNKGDLGEQGIKGQKGAKGNQGGKGARGDKGIEGDKGQKGLKGAKGAVTVVGEIIGVLPNPGPPTAVCDTDQTVIIDSDGDAWICLAGTWNNIGKIVGPPGSPGAEGEKGAQGIKGTKGEIGIGTKGTKGDKGEIGSQGVKGVAGPKGPKGTKGREGADGLKGIKGKDGEKGNKGIQGKDGSDGPKGSKGAKGQQGVAGPQGFGDKGIKGNRGEKGFKGSAGREGPKGELGPKGADGVIGTIDGVHKGDGPPPAGNCLVEGEIIVDDAGVAWRCDGSGSWDSLGEITGAPGVAGTKGIKGAKGEAGWKGNDGEKGDQGLQGEPGQKGSRGDVGAKGEAGQPGPKGTGTKGAVGPEGPKGLKGEQGLQGLKGEDGPKGAKGARSTVKGNKGEAGNDGVKGGDGTAGAKGAKGEPGIKGDVGLKGDPGTGGAGGSWGHIEYVKAGSNDEYRDSSIFKDDITDPGKTIRRVYFYNNQLRVELAAFSVDITTQGQSLYWDEPATEFSVNVDQPSDYPDQYIASVSGLTDVVGMHPTIGDYTTGGPTPTPAGGVDWSQTFETNSTATIYSNGGGLNGGNASGKVTFIDEDGDAYEDTPTVSFGWQNVSSDLSVSSLNGATFLETYTSTNYSISVSGLKSQSRVTHSVVAINGVASNPTGDGSVTFNQPLHKDNASGRSVALTSTFTRPANVTGASYAATDSDSENVNASFTYPSWLIATVDRQTPPTIAEVITGTDFTPEVTVRGDQQYRLNEMVTNNEPVPRALWFAVRSSATQPTTFKVGDSANIIFDVDVTTAQIALQPDTPPAGYTPEQYTLYGITLQTGNTYVSIN